LDCPSVKDGDCINGFDLGAVVPRLRDESRNFQLSDVWDVAESIGGAEVPRLRDESSNFQLSDVWDYQLSDVWELAESIGGGALALVVPRVEDESRNVAYSKAWNLTEPIWKAAKARVPDDLVDESKNVPHWKLLDITEAIWKSGIARVANDLLDELPHDVQYEDVLELLEKNIKLLEDATGWVDCVPVWVVDTALRYLGAPALRLVSWLLG